MVDLDAAVRKLRVALDDLTMPLGKGGWDSCLADILESAPIVVAEVDRLRAEVERENRDFHIQRVRAERAEARIEAFEAVLAEADDLAWTDVPVELLYTALDTRQHSD